MSDWTLRRAHDLIRLATEGDESFAMISLRLGTGKRLALCRALHGAVFDPYIIACPKHSVRLWEELMKRGPIERAAIVMSTHYLARHYTEMQPMLSSARALIIEHPRGPKQIAAMGEAYFLARKTIIIDHVDYDSSGIQERSTMAATSILNTPGLVAPSFYIEGPMLSGKEAE